MTETKIKTKSYRNLILLFSVREACNSRDMLCLQLRAFFDVFSGAVFTKGIGQNQRKCTAFIMVVAVFAFHISTCVSKSSRPYFPPQFVYLLTYKFSLHHCYC